ncbi:receptor-like protein 40 [Rutidosis leptorrhynchoides]|uniref:receptor-like protein 40 n=1 Tax=Rutidosis leptorrhynchoides TaxID=125765 RepID=UPI003A992914
MIMLLSCCITMILSVSVHSQCLQDQSSSLLKFKQNVVFVSYNSFQLYTWNSSKDCCSWRGVTCNIHGHVIGLVLSNEGIVGEIPMDISNLIHLEILDLSSPTDSNNQQVLKLRELRMLVQNLSNLTELYLDNVWITSSENGNELSRALSSPSLQNLRVLHMSGCQLSGPIESSAVHNLRKLRLTDLFLTGNKLNGSISSTFWNQLSNLTFLDLSDNLLSGEIPKSLFEISDSLVYIGLSHNRFSSLPTEFPMPSSSASQLHTLDIACNEISGALPSWIWEMTNLITLNVSFNQVSGLLNDHDDEFIPYLNGSQPFKLDLSCNRINGKLPSWIWEISYLGWLNVSHNFLVEIGKPSTKGLTSEMIVVDLHANQIQGQIQFPPPSAHYINYSGNNFSSAIPIDLSYHINSTRFLFLSGNNLQGSIPDSICHGFLRVLDLSNNSFTGKVPKCLFKSSPSLSALKLSTNKLNRSISD